MVIFSASIRAVADGKPVTNWRRNSDNSNKKTKAQFPATAFFTTKSKAFRLGVRRAPLV
jgi:hypothetical protein